MGLWLQHHIHPACRRRIAASHGHLPHAINLWRSDGHVVCHGCRELVAITA